MDAKPKPCFIDTQGNCHVHGAPAVSRCEVWMAETSTSAEREVAALKEVAEIAGRVLDALIDTPLSEREQFHYTALYISVNRLAAITKGDA